MEKYCTILTPENIFCQINNEEIIITFKYDHSKILSLRNILALKCHHLIVNAITLKNNHFNRLSH